jgi:NTE family protein
MATIKKTGKAVTGLVLSGGGARGYAHLGVMKALNEEGIFPDIISGTSAGAIAGAFYADGYKPEEILRILSENSRLNLMSFTIPKEGLMKMSGMIRLLRDYLRAKTFEELKIPLYVTGTDLNNGKIVYFSSGDIINPVVASASIPVVFRPVVINNISYVDGGVIDNMPIAPIEKHCSRIIGSYVNPLGERAGFTSFMAIAERSFQLSVSKDISAKRRRFDLFISPGELCKYNAFDQGKAKDMFAIGYDEAKKRILEFRSRQKFMSL